MTKVFITDPGQCHISHRGNYGQRGYGSRHVVIGHVGVVVDESNEDLLNEEDKEVAAANRCQNIEELAIIWQTISEG